MANVIFVYLT